MGSRQSKIQPVASNRAKSENYSAGKMRYKIAMRSGFYFEALLIVYAMMEDRLRSFLYYAGVLKSTDARGASGATRDRVLSIKQFCHIRHNDNLGVTGIVDKIDIVEGMMRWCDASDSGQSDDAYLNVLKTHLIKKFDPQEVLALLNGLREWLAYRNEINHALLNKNSAVVDATIAERCQQGMRLAMQLDNYAGRMKSGNRIRKTLGWK